MGLRRKLRHTRSHVGGIARILCVLVLLSPLSLSALTSPVSRTSIGTTLASHLLHLSGMDWVCSLTRPTSVKTCPWICYWAPR